MTIIGTTIIVPHVVSFGNDLRLRRDYVFHIGALPHSGDFIEAKPGNPVGIDSLIWVRTEPMGVCEPNLHTHVREADPDYYKRLGYEELPRVPTRDAWTRPWQWACP